MFVNAGLETMIESDSNIKFEADLKEERQFKLTRV